MTDELSMQQIPQQRGSYAVPGLVGGAIVGGAAGYAGANYKNWGVTYNKPDLDKIFAQKPDEFESMAKRAGDNKSKIDEAKDIVKGVQDLEKQYDEKIAELQKTGGITDDQLSKELVNKRNRAQSAYDSALEAEKRRIGSATTAPVAELPTRKELLKELTTEEFTAFEPFLKKYENAKKALLGTPGAQYAGSTAKAPFDNIKAQKTKAGKIYDDFFTKYDALSDSNKEKFNPSSRANMKVINTEVNEVLPADFGKKLGKGSRFTYTQFEEFQRRFGEDMFEITDIKPDEVADKKVYELKNPSTGKKSYVVIDTEMVKAEREALRTGYAENIKDAMDLKTKIKNFDKDFFETNKDALAVDFEGAIKNEANLKAVLGDKDTLKNLNKDIANIEVLEESIAKGVKKFPVTVGTAVCNNAEELNIVKTRAQVARDWAEKYVKESKALENEMKAIVRKDPRVASAYAKFKQAIAQDKGVKAALAEIEKLNGKYSTESQKALYERIQGLIGSEATSELSEEEILSKAKEALEGKKVTSDLDAVQKEIAKYAEEHGIKGEITEEEAIKKFGKTKEEFIKVSKDEAKTKLEELLKDIKFANKTTTGLVAAGVLALVGLGLGNMMKKD